jgi:ankyrin repeat protein
VNAVNNMGATPLLLAATSPEKVKLLLAAGANPNTATKMGRTPLIVTAAVPGAIEAVRALLAAGAAVDHADERGMTAVANAALYGDLAVVRILIEKGAKVNVTDKAGFTPLLNATAHNDIERLKLFLGHGIDVNASNVFAGKVKNGDIALTKMTALIFTAAHGTPDMVRALIDAGAKVNVQDGRGVTPLIAAVSSDTHDPNVVKLLLAAGAAVNASDANGETALDWARKAGNPAIQKMLVAAGGKGRTYDGVVVKPAPADAPVAVQRSLTLLQKTTVSFFNNGGCVGCHHQPMAWRAMRKASEAGLAVPLEARAEQVRAMSAMRPVEPVLLQMVDPGGDADTISNTLVGFGSAGLPPNTMTDAAVNFIAARQQTNGAWTFRGIARPPFEESDITRTAAAVRALQLYGWPARTAEFKERIGRAREWLMRAEPRTSYERAELLLGLHWSGAPQPVVARAATALLKEQRTGGGWSQNKYLTPDAYATGLSLYALSESGQATALNPAYRKGVAYLLRTQAEDGSWYVRSRAPKFQPYFQSGFPYDHDQWISAAATAYATMALVPTAAEETQSALRAGVRSRRR